MKKFLGGFILGGVFVVVMSTKYSEEITKLVENLAAKAELKADLIKHDRLTD